MIAARFIELIGILHKNPNSFAADLGVSASIIYNIIGGRKSKPSCDILEKIKQVYPQVNLNWVIASQGEALMDSNTSPAFSNQIVDLSNRMHQIERLASVRDQYIAVLQNKIDTLKEQMDTTKK